MTTRCFSSTALHTSSSPTTWKYDPYQYDDNDEEEEEDQKDYVHHPAAEDPSTEKSSSIIPGINDTTTHMDTVSTDPHTVDTTTGTTTLTTATVIVEEENEHSSTTTQEPRLWHPERDFNMTYPKALSPSAINEFMACPQSFLFQYIYGIKQPTTTALAQGSMCHAALEHVFDLDANDRTLEHLQNLFRKEWSKHRKSDTYKPLFYNNQTQQWDLDAEAEWGRGALQLLENYVHYEDPRQVSRPNPVQREVWVSANLSLDPHQGVTYHPDDDEVEEKDKVIDASQTDQDNEYTFLVRGIVDRLDMVRDPVDKSVVMRLTDYKTGKAPDLKYSPAMNEKIVAQNFFQLQIYALLLREKNNDRHQQSTTMDLRLLRLLYLTSVSGPAVAWDYDLGATQDERDVVLQSVHAKLAQVWMDIVELVSQQNPKSWHGCTRSFCYCHKCRPKFEPGTLWEPPVEK
jgi:RecB family exonuclease